jgi:hypothetical protein
MEGYPEITKDNWKGGVQVEELNGVGEYEAEMRWPKPLPMPSITIINAEAARQFVLNNAGATLPVRDAVDKRITEQARTGKIIVPEGVTPPATQFKHRRAPLDSYKQGVITDISQVGGYPEYKGTPYKDSDNDGMPDSYEIKNKLNPNDATDAAKITAGGYSNIEVYLSSVVDIKNVKPATPNKK